MTLKVVFNILNELNWLFGKNMQNYQINPWFLQNFILVPQVSKNCILVLFVNFIQDNPILLMNQLGSRFNLPNLLFLVNILTNYQMVLQFYWNCKMTPPSQIHTNLPWHAFYIHCLNILMLFTINLFMHIWLPRINNAHLSSL